MLTAILHEENFSGFKTFRPATLGDLDLIRGLGVIGRPDCTPTHEPFDPRLHNFRLARYFPYSLDLMQPAAVKAGFVIIVQPAATNAADAAGDEGPEDVREEVSPVGEDSEGDGEEFGLHSFRRNLLALCGEYTEAAARSEVASRAACAALSEYEQAGFIADDACRALREFAKSYDGPLPGFVYGSVTLATAPKAVTFADIAIGGLFATPLSVYRKTDPIAASRQHDGEVAIFEPSSVVFRVAF
jgi:hypothetical protein